MKKCGDIYTAKGKGTTGTVERLELFDGKFNTAFRLVSIDIASDNPTGVSEEVSIKVMTEHSASSAAWDWSKNTEIAWASVNHPAGSRWGYNTYVDPDNLIVENVYIDFSGTADAGVNYMLKFQKYDISDWRGALAMVRNSAQNA